MLEGNKFYGIYVNSEVDEGEDVFIALTDSEEKRDSFIEVIQSYIDNGDAFNRLHREAVDRQLELRREAKDKFPTPEPVYDDTIPPSVSPAALIKYRSEQIAKGNVEQADATLLEIKEIERSNYLNNEKRKGHTVEWQNACTDVYTLRERYVFENLSEKMKACLQIGNGKGKFWSLPYISKVEWKEIIVNDFGYRGNFAEVVKDIKGVLDMED